MGVEPWGLYPPELNAGRLEMGFGLPTWLLATAKWTAMAGITAELQAAFVAQVGALTGNWQGLAPQTLSAGSAPFAAWLVQMQAAATTNAGTALSVVQSYATAMATMVPLPVIIVNRIMARAWQVAGVLGAPNPEMVRLELEYAAFWVQNALVMSGYDISVNTATAFRPVPPPPPLAMAPGGVDLAAAASKIKEAAQALSRGASSAKSLATQTGRSLLNNGQPHNQYRGPNLDDAGKWSSLMGSGAGAGSGAGSGAGGGGAGNLAATMPSMAPTGTLAKPAASISTPRAGFPGILPQASNAARTSGMPMSPFHPPHNQRREQSSSTTQGPILAAEQEFPLTPQATEQPHEKVLAAVSAPEKEPQPS